MEIGDILFNPYALDYWIVCKRYNSEEDKDELYIHLIHEDYDEDISVGKSFIKIGNIYDLEIKEV